MTRPAPCHPDRPHYGKGLCKQCYTRAWQDAHPGYHRETWRKHFKPENRRRATLRKFGITIAEYDALLASQGGRCAICGNEKAGGRWETLCVDHNHETGQVRGLLCLRCNRAVGLLKDDEAVARKMADYLAQWAAKGKKKGE